MDNKELHHSKRPILISIFPMLFLVLSAHANPTPENTYINIISPSNNSQVQTGNLTITGTAVYDSIQPCTVYATWNYSQPLQRPVNIINEDKNYSMWKFNFNRKSHEIIEGPNTLSGILSCLNSHSSNLTMFSTIKVNGLERLDKENISFDKGSGFSDIVTTPEQSHTQGNNDVFSSNNYELAIPITEENEAKHDFPITDEFERINRTSANGILQFNRTVSSASPPSILEIESNLNSNRLMSYSNNTQLMADAGLDQTVSEGTSVILNGSNSKSNNNVILSYEWKQIPHPNITVVGANTMIWSFVTPYVSTDTTLTFELIVTDNKGMTSTDDVNINVRDNHKTVNEAEMTDRLLTNESPKSETETSSEPRTIVIQILVDHNPVSRGEDQVIMIDLIDANSDDRIHNATIRGEILDSSEKTIKKFSEDDDNLELSLNIPENSKIGDFVIKVNATAPGYFSSNTETHFKVLK